MVGTCTILTRLHHKTPTVLALNARFAWKNSSALLSGGKKPQKMTALLCQCAWMGATKHDELEGQIPALTLHDVGRLTERGLSRSMWSGEGGKLQAHAPGNSPAAMLCPAGAAYCVNAPTLCTFLLNLTTCVKDCSCALEFDVVYLS
jgi:hypothetical protein